MRDLGLSLARARPGRQRDPRGRRHGQSAPTGARPRRCWCGGSADPTRASLDYAAYHANFMNADPAPEGSGALAPGQRPSVANPFGGVLVAELADRLRGEDRAHRRGAGPSAGAAAARRAAGVEEDRGWRPPGGRRGARPRGELGPSRRAAVRAPDRDRGVPARSRSGPTGRALAQDRVRALVSGILLAARRGRRRLSRDLRPCRRQRHRPHRGDRQVHPQRVRGPRLHAGGGQSLGASAGLVLVPLVQHRSLGRDRQVADQRHRGRGARRAGQLDLRRADRRHAWQAAGQARVQRVPGRRGPRRQARREDRRAGCITGSPAAAKESPAAPPPRS